MSKLIHFQDQLAATSNPDPILYYMIRFEEDCSPEDPFRLQVLRTRKSQINADLVGMKFLSMNGNDTGKFPIFMNELVDA